MSASAAASTNDEETRTREYYHYLDQLRAEQVPVFTAKLRGTEDDVAVILKMDINSGDDAWRADLATQRKKIHTKIKREWQCQTCADRMRNAFIYVDKNGKSVLCPVSEGRTPLQKNVHDLCDTYINSYINAWHNRGLHWQYEIVRADTLYAHAPTWDLAKKSTETAWRHYSWVPEENSEALSEHCLKDGSNILELLEKALNKYCPMMIKLSEEMLSDGPEMLRSMELIRELLLKASYGKQQVAAVDWIIKYIKTVIAIRSDWNSLRWNQKINCVIKAVCDCSLSIADDDSGDVLCGLFHSVNGNVLSLLQKGESPQAVVRMIEERNDPRNYKQTTAPPKAVHIEKAANLFKGFKATMHTTSQLEQLPGCATVKAGPSDDVDDVFGAMAAEAKTRKKSKQKYSGFASRMSGKVKGDPTNMRELMEGIRDGSITKLEMIPSSHTVYTADWEGENLKSSDFCVPHLWIFISDNRFGRYNFMELTHVYRLKTTNRENYFFIIKDARNTLYSKPFTTNCTLSEFLATKHQKTAGKPFHALKDKTKIQIPPAFRGSLSLGTGCSVDKDDSLMSTMRFRINGKEVCIRKNGF